MRKVVIALAASAVLPVLALGQLPRSPMLASSPASTGIQPSVGKVILVDHCTVTPLAIDGEALVPAQEAGVLLDYARGLKEGDEVKSGFVMARIDDAMAQKQLANATAEFNAANQKAQSNTDVEVAEAAAKTAEYEYARMKAANEGSTGKDGIAATKGVKGAVTDVDLMHSWYQWKHAVLAIDQYKNEKKVNGYTAEAKKAEMETGQESVNRREVRAPFDGVVQRMTPHKGEWLKPGDTVIRLMRMDHLKVEGFLRVADYDPSDVLNRNVIVKVTLAHGREEEFTGKIVYVDQEVQSEREYMVRAEVENRRDKQTGAWLLRPGLPAKMAIQ
jgi:multidrug efflux pump subunit AcrA (membrane-fusion protein)